MYPRPFEYAQAHSVTDAVAALGSGEEARVLAGGQSLVPMMSLGLALPRLLVDINRLDLAGAEQRGGRVSIGALTRHRELELSRELRSLVPLAAEAAGHVGNPRVRNRGTFGGSLCNGDPAAELAAVCVAHGGDVVLAGPDGERSVAVEDFLHGYYETDARPDEVLVRAELDLPPAGSGTAFVEIANRADAFALAGAAAIVSLGAGERCAAARVVLIGTGGTPARLPGAEHACAGAAWGESLAREVGRVAAAVIVPEADLYVSVAYRRRCAAVCVERALERAFARARQERG